MGCVGAWLIVVRLIVCNKNCNVDNVISHCVVVSNMFAIRIVFEDPPNASCNDLIFYY